MFSDIPCSRSRSGFKGCLFCTKVGRNRGQTQKRSTHMRTRNCQGCGKPLVKPRRNQLYHSDICKHSAYRAREKLEKPALDCSPMVVLAGIDTLYLNAYYADPHLLTRITQPLDEALQTAFTTLQQQAKASRQEVETSWSLEEQPLHMLSHGEGKQWHWILKNELVNIQIGKGD